MSTFIHISDSNSDTPVLPLILYTGLCGVDKIMKGFELKAKVSTLLYFLRSVVFARRFLPLDLVQVIEWRCWKQDYHI